MTVVRRNSICTAEHHHRDMTHINNNNNNNNEMAVRPSMTVAPPGRTNNGASRLRGRRRASTDTNNNNNANIAVGSGLGLSSRSLSLRRRAAVAPRAGQDTAQHAGGGHDGTNENPFVDDAIVDDDDENYSSNDSMSVEELTSPYKSGGGGIIKPRHNGHCNRNNSNRVGPFNTATRNNNPFDDDDDDDDNNNPFGYSNDDHDEDSAFHNISGLLTHEDIGQRHNETTTTTTTNNKKKNGRTSIDRGTARSSQLSSSYKPISRGDGATATDERLWLSSSSWKPASKRITTNSNNTSPRRRKSADTNESNSRCGASLVLSLSSDKTRRINNTNTKSKNGSSSNNKMIIVGDGDNKMTQNNNKNNSRLSLSSSTSTQSPRGDYYYDELLPGASRKKKVNTASKTTTTTTTMTMNKSSVAHGGGGGRSINNNNNGNNNINVRGRTTHRPRDGVGRGDSGGGGSLRSTRNNINHNRSSRRSGSEGLHMSMNSIGCASLRLSGLSSDDNDHIFHQENNDVEDGLGKYFLQRSLVDYNATTTTKMQSMQDLLVEERSRTSTKVFPKVINNNVSGSTRRSGRRVISGRRSMHIMPGQGRTMKRRMAQRKCGLIICVIVVLVSFIVGLSIYFSSDNNNKTTSGSSSSSTNAINFGTTTTTTTTVVGDSAPSTMPSSTVAVMGEFTDSDSMTPAKSPQAMDESSSLATTFSPAYNIPTFCPDGQYCYYKIGSCAVTLYELTLTGTCQPQPTDCPLVYMPVCDCDGNTHANFCNAAKSGLSILHAGECGKDVPGVVVNGDDGDTDSNSDETADGDATLCTASFQSLIPTSSSAPSPVLVNYGIGIGGEDKSGPPTYSLSPSLRPSMSTVPSISARPSSNITTLVSSSSNVTSFTSSPSLTISPTMTNPPSQRPSMSTVPSISARPSSNYTTSSSLSSPSSLPNGADSNGSFGPAKTILSPSLQPSISAKPIFISTTTTAPASSNNNTTVSLINSTSTGNSLDQFAND